MKKYKPTESQLKLLKELEEKAISVLAQCDIIVERVPLYIHHSVRTYGQCTYKRISPRTLEPKYDINISFSNKYIDYCLENNGYEDLINTMIHEYLHAYCAQNGVLCGHNGMWKSKARIISMKTNYDITRLSKIYIKERDYKYLIKCDCCGSTYKYVRESKAIKRIRTYGKDSGYHCGKCGNRNLRIVE